MLSGSIKSVSESFKCFSPQTPLIFAGDFGTREMLLTATRPQGERIDFISKNFSSEMPFFLLLERIVKLRIKTSQDGHFEFRRWVIPTLKPIVALLTIYNVSKDIIERFSLKKKKTSKQTRKRTYKKKQQKNKKWLKIDNVPTCLLALKSN